MLTFNELGFSSQILKGIEELGFKTPTPVQEEIIPLVLETKKDIIGLAQTGTGKTAAFGLPLIEQIDLSDRSVQVLVLAPTRELCMQITKDLQSFSKYSPGLEVVPVYGGASIDTQIKALKKGAHVIAATPGRMIDLIKRKAAKINNIHTLVLDEADEMLNMGFREELDEILETAPKQKRTLLFSATMSNEVARIASNYLNDPEKVTIGKQNAGAENVRHIYYQVHATDRYLALKRIADINPDIYGIVFCRTRRETQEVADKLIKDGYNADALHGDLSQSQRDHVMKRFRERTIQMLVATDVAARGIDVNDISHIINYNLPDENEIYTHRSGRTGRADKSGICISIVNYREKSRISQIEKMIGKHMQKLPVPGGEEICKKQLFNLIDRMEKVEVDEEQIAPFMDTVFKKLEWLSKEEIIKHFVSLEFNRFLEYYRKAPDLNKKAEDRNQEPGNRRDRSRGDRNPRDRGGRDERGGERRGRDRGGRDERGGERRGRKEKGNFARFFITLGKKDGVEPKNIIGLINDNANDRDINIGNIDIKDNFSFFEVGDRHADKVLDSFRKTTFKGKPVRIEIAEEDVGGRKKGKENKKKGKRF